MTGKGTTIIAILLILCSFCISHAEVRNVIIMISDGCGYNHIETADDYQYGQVGLQAYEGFPIALAVSTYSDDCRGEYSSHYAWQNFDYVSQWYTDSAAAATAMSTGVKTSNGTLGISSIGDSLKHLIDYAEDSGKATGVVTSVLWSHATPAGFMAHNSDRGNSDQIAQEIILDSRVDVVMGCGHPWFDDSGDSLVTPISYLPVGNYYMWSGLIAGQTGFDPQGIGMVTDWVSDADGDDIIDPWTLVQSRDEFVSLIEGDTPSRVLGTAQVWATLQCNRAGDPTSSPFTDPFNDNVPTLAEMALGAINVIDDDPDGFFLMIEGGAIDWASHSNYIGRMIEEEMAFNDAVDSVVAWVEAYSSWDETVLIVTADHETGYLTGPDSGPGLPPVWNSILNNGIGVVPGYEWHSGSHTNSLIPLYANGSGSERFNDFADKHDVYRGYYLDNTEIFQVVMDLWNLSSEIPMVATTPLDTSTLISKIDWIRISPNPFNPLATIAYNLHSSGYIKLTVYNSRGQVVEKLVDGWRSQGIHEFTFDGSLLPSGVYFYRLEYAEKSGSDNLHNMMYGKMVLIK